ncbi:HlyD family efflux transporter periplasmic adaptor subunit [Paracoccus sp. MBLB3053]|uniref:HlyD family efflux transporter periplasmic adaptor subunit n=1 Tax=Paracoccus aurantius TaxID=3073814 RepID=A0ABU2HY43_9RHOB|nr:HlyD family efflux transporter periplasmic adaptor subunit [Paracoccus sp. MBLB3053]MDS9469445.1 HlyD family efflux transporter periplasmic adaptor subunit [Paracoccus sp. MBLB3053]
MRKAFPVVILIAAFALGGWWWSERDSQSPDALIFQGNVDIRQVALAFDGSGRVVQIDVDEGDQVKTGDVLAQIDTKTLELQAREAEAQLEAARQDLLRLQNGTRPEEIDQIKAQLVSAEATAQRVARDYERLAKLLTGRSGAVSAQSVEQAASESDAATAKVAEVRAALALAEAGPRVEEVAAAKARHTAMEANLALLNYQIEQGTLRAPIDAVVRSRLLEPGDQATPQKPVFALSVNRPKWIRLYIGEPDLGRIQPGMPAEIRTDSDAANPFAGKVGYISSVAEFTPKYVQTEELRTSLVYEVRVIVDDAADKLRLGQPVTVELGLGRMP